MPVEAPPAPAAQADPSPNMTDAFAELDQFAGVAPEAKPETPATPETPSKEAPKATTVQQKTTQDAPKPEKPVQTPPAPTDPPKVKAKTLAEAKEMAQAEAKEWRAKYESLEKELSKVKDDPEKKTLSERLEAREKRLAELEQELRYSAYERSEEYKDKYEQPFLNAYTAARSKIASLKVRDGRTVDHDGNVVSEGTWRQGTPEDFDTLMRISDDETAADYAEKVFGNKASIALFHRERAQELNRQRLTAIDDYRKKGSEREKTTLEQQKEQQTKLQETINKVWETENKTAQEKYPQWFKPEEGDEKGNTLLENGFRLADLAFSGNGKLPPQEMAKLHSAIRNKAGGFDRLAYKLSLATKELKDLKAKLAEYEQSEPTGGVARKQKAAAQSDDMESVLESMASFVTK